MAFMASNDGGSSRAGASRRVAPAAGRRRTLLLAAAVGLCAAVVGQAKPGGGLALPGDPAYYTKLLNIEAVEGDLSPPFSADGERFTVKLSHGDTDMLHLILMLDLSKYSPTHCPTISVDGKKLDYSPLDQLKANIPLEYSVGPAKKEVKIKISDPKNSGGGLFGWGATVNEHEYVFDIEKPPQLAKIVSAEEISLKDEHGASIASSPAFDPEDSHQKNLRFTLPDKVKKATLKVACPKFDGISQLVDGNPVAEAVSTRELDFSKTYRIRTDVTCSYYNAAYSTGTVQRTYIVDAGKHEDASAVSSISAELRMIPDFGWCESVAATDENLADHPRKGKEPDFGEVAATTGFVCRSHRDTAKLVATFSSAGGASPSASVIREHEDGARKATSISNAIPSTFETGPERRFLSLHVEAGDLGILYPVVLIRAADCETIECPFGQGPKLFNTQNAQETMCLAEECEVSDQAHCCAKKAMCNAYTGGCPVGQSLRWDAAQMMCDGVECTLEKDQSRCCALPTTATETITQTETSTITTTTTPPTTSTEKPKPEEPTKTTTSTTTLPPTSTSTATETTTTAKTSTTTTVTTTTVTTTMFCTEHDKVWLPLDMPLQQPTVEDDYLACQARCARTAGCLHFSFWRAARHCHLQDATAHREQYGFGFDSGPPQCTTANLVPTTTTNPVPRAERCIQRGVNWLPLLDGGAPRPLFHASKQAMIGACQNLCAETYNCAQFELDTVTGYCRLAGWDATGYPGAPDSLVSGPPYCDGSHEDLAGYILKYGRPTGRSDTPSTGVHLSPGVLAMLGAAAVAGAAVAVAAGFRRRTPRPSRTIGHGASLLPPRGQGSHRRLSLIEAEQDPEAAAATADGAE